MPTSSCDRGRLILLATAFACLQLLATAAACANKCEQKWDPVCGSDRRTYANKCVAKCAGAAVAHTGRCKTAFFLPIAAAGFACTDKCEQKWDPVCGKDGKTYANKCVAICAGTTVKHTGRCTAAFACTDNCEQKWDPVCGKDGQTHANKCVAICAGTTVKQTGRCAALFSVDKDSGVITKYTCSGVYDPVCGVDNRTYTNACLAGRANIGVKHTGPCMR